MPDQKQIASQSGSESEFKYHRECKLPSCRIPFGTNREWQDFHEDECRLEWHKLLRRSHDETIVEVELLKERVKRLELALGLK